MRKMSIWIALLPAAAACGPGGGGEAGPEVFTDTIGDTIVVRTLAGNVWGGDATLVPEVAIGEMDGPEEELFGNLTSLAVDDDRNVYLLDRQEQAVRIFDAGGGYVGKLGRKGRGPGELWDARRMATLPDGRVIVRDQANMRVQVYGPGPGEEEAWSYNSGNLSSGEPLWTDREGRTYVIATDRSNPERAWARIFIVLGPDGTPADTLPPPLAEFEAISLEGQTENASVSWPLPFAAQAEWALHPDGGFLSGISSQYRIDVEFPGRVLRIERVYDPVPVSREEGAAARDQVERGIRMSIPEWSWDGPSIPDVKPPFTALHAGRNGRIWVELSTEGIRTENEDHDPRNPFSQPVFWLAAVRYDVFEPDGAYLGAVHAPEDFSSFPRPVFDGDYVWGVTRDDLGVQRVVRYRIEVGTGS